MNFHSRLNDQRDALYVNVRGEDRPNIIAEVTNALEHEGLYVSSIAFNLTSPDQDQFAMEIVAKGNEHKLVKCLLAIDTESFLPIPTAQRKWPRIRWANAWMFHIGLYTPDKAGLVAKISSIVGKPHPDKVGSNAAVTGSFVHLLGIIVNSDGAQGGTPHFSLRANVAVETEEIQEEIIDHLQRSARHHGFLEDLWILRLNRPKTH